MAINKKLIHFKSKQKFNEELAKGNILETSIVFILETTEIYTHGLFYAGSTFDPSDIEASIQNIINNKQDTITDLEVIRQGAAKGATALQSYTEQYKGTVTGVKINGSTKNPSNGVVDLGTVIIEHQDISHLATKAEIPTVPTKISDLTDDSNFITIKIIDDMDGLDVPSDIEIPKNNENSSSTGAYLLVNHGTSDTTFTLTPNTFHVWNEVQFLALTIGDETAGVANEYIFQFTSGSEPTTLTLPASIKFNSDFTVEANKIYQISILSGLGTVMSWDSKKIITFNVKDAYDNSYTYQAEEGMTWEEWVNSEYNTDGYFIYNSSVCVDHKYGDMIYNVNNFDTINSQNYELGFDFG